MNTAPKKILRIKDFTFILPDNFSGSFEDALEEFKKYSEEKKKPSDIRTISDKYSSMTAVLSSKTEANACGAYGIFELDEHGRYHLIESSDM